MLTRSSLTYVDRCYGEKTPVATWVATATMNTINIHSIEDVGGAESTVTEESALFCEYQKGDGQGCLDRDI